MNPNTDTEWERWGQREPYFGVITDAKFRRQALTTESKKDFFDSGVTHVDYVLHMIRLHISSDFRPTTVLDFGCGVGRTLVAFARVSDRVVGMDVATSMLDEARANCRSFGADSIELELSDDELLRAPGRFDLVHSFIVFQHIAPERGKTLFARLIQRIAPGGVGAIHVLYSKSAYDASLGVAPASSAVLSPRHRLAAMTRSGDADERLRRDRGALSSAAPRRAPRPSSSPTTVASSACFSSSRSA